MRILFIQRNAQVGGGNTYLRVVARELRERGHETRLLIGPGPLYGELGAAMGTPPALNPPLPFLAAAKVRRLLRTQRIEVVDAHTFKVGQMALDACRAAGIPLVLHVHSLIPLDEAACVLQDAARIVVMNRAVRDWVGRVEGVAAKTVLSVLPVDLDRFHPTTSAGDGFHIVYCGRLARRKAAYVSYLLEAFEELSRTIPGLRMTVIGGRSHWREIASRARQVNRAAGREAVDVLGQRLDPSVQIASADVVIGTGYVALEGLACGKHVIGVGIQGLVGLVTEEGFEAAAAANFGDHAAFDTEVTAAKLAREVLAAYEAWKQSPVLSWGPERVRRDYSAERACNDLERAFTEAVSETGRPAE